MNATWSETEYRRNGYIRLSVRLRAEERDAVDELAARWGISRADVVGRFAVAAMSRELGHRNGEALSEATGSRQHLAPGEPVSHPGTALRAALSSPWSALREAAAGVVRGAIAEASTLQAAAERLGVSRATLHRVRSLLPDSEK